MNNNVYLLSHNGLGDNITMIGAVRFLLNFYDKVHFLCKNIYSDNVKMFFNNERVIIIPFDYKNESAECHRIIHSAYNHSDVLICGCHLNNLKSKITNQNISKHVKNDGKYSVKWQHIYKFYNDIGLDLKIYYEMFDIPSSSNSIQYYNAVCNYKIIFTHTKSSNLEICFDEFDEYIHDDDYLIICANKNVYSENHSKFNIAQSYINLPVSEYIDIIKKASHIYAIDSCFSCIINPLQKTNRLIANTVVIRER